MQDPCRSIGIDLAIAKLVPTIRHARSDPKLGTDLAIAKIVPYEKFVVIYENLLRVLPTQIS
jgi:hypothetical protein